MKVSFEGIGETSRNLYNSGGGRKGRPGKAVRKWGGLQRAAGENFAGVAISVNGGFAAVRSPAM